jgi:hypothetical protein
MARISLSTAYANRRDCWRLKLAGQSVRAIAATLNISKGSVQNYLSLPLPEISPDEFLAVCVQIRAESPWLGVIPVADRAGAQLGLDVLPVSKTVIAAHFKAQGVPVFVPRATLGDSRRPFYFDNAWINKPRDVWQLDTVKLTLADGTQLEFLVVLDMHSRMSWAVYLPEPGYEAWALRQCFEVLGVPGVISADNGRGWPMDNGATLSDLIAIAFLAGVERFQFIPVSRPQYNGRVERSNRTLKHRAWLHRARYDMQTVDEVVDWVYGAVREYNEVFTHRALGGTGKKNRRTPLDVHLETNEFALRNDRPALHNVYTPRPNVEPRVLSFSHAEKQAIPGVVSYIRRISNQGHAFIGVPELTFDLGAQVGTWYARFDLSYGGQGSVTLFDPVLRLGRVIGRFRHNYGAAGPVQRFIKVELLTNEFIPRANDDLLETHLEQAHGKRKASRPEGYVPGGSRYCPNPDDPHGWILRNRRGQIIDSSDWKHRPDHSDDLFGA